MPLAEGLFLGAISGIFEMQYPGIVIQAVGLTLGTLASLLFLYKTGIVKPTENFKLMVTSATMGIGLLYVVSMLMNMFGSGGIGFIHSNGLFGIGFSLFVVAIAALKSRLRLSTSLSRVRRWALLSTWNGLAHFH